MSTMTANRVAASLTAHGFTRTFDELLFLLLGVTFGTCGGVCFLFLRLAKFFCAIPMINDVTVLARGWNLVARLHITFDHLPLALAFLALWELAVFAPITFLGKFNECAPFLLYLALLALPKL